MDESLAITAVNNGGYFTRAEALDLGFIDRDLAALARAGVIRRIRHGSYVPCQSYDGLDPSAQHLVLAKATLARQRGSVALAGVSAAAAHGLLLYGHSLDTVQLVRLDGGASRREVSARHHVFADDLTNEVELVNGVLATNLVRTVWDVACHASLEAGVVTVDSALHRDPALADVLADTRSRLGHRPGSRRARMVLDLSDGRSDGAGESLSRVLFFRHRVPPPEPQYHVCDGAGRLLGIADFLWEADHHLGEFDGKVKYGRLRRAGESEGDAVFREKRREDLMRAEMFGMTRWVWADLMGDRGRHLVDRLNRDRERSRQLFTRNRTIIA